MNRFVVLVFLGYLLLQCGVYRGEEVLHRSRRNVINASVLREIEKRYSVILHNAARSDTNPSGSNLQKMSWDEELGKTAEEYSRKCIYAHSSGRKHSKFDWVGENLYVGSPEVAPMKILNTAIKHWDDEKLNYTYETQECTAVCSHYTQVVWDDTYAVGCGMTTCKDIYVGDGETWEVGQLVVCHYGPGGNKNERQPYDMGIYCSVCPKGFWCENNLCTDRGNVFNLSSILLMSVAMHVFLQTQ